MVLLHVFWLLIVSALGFASPLRAQEPPFPVPDGLEGAVSFWKQIFAQYRDRKSTRLNSSHMSISYAVFCLKKKKIQDDLFLGWLLPYSYESMAPFRGSRGLPYAEMLYAGFDVHPFHFVLDWHAVLLWPSGV